MRSLILVFGLIGTIWALGGSVRAQTPDPTAGTPPAMGLIVPLGRQLGLPYISWEPVEGAAGYRLSGTIRMVRVNRDDPFCTAPVVEDTETLTVGDETLIAPKIDHVDLPVPELSPEDAWFFAEAHIQIEAVDGDAYVIAADSGGGIAESTAPCPIPTATPGVVLPPTGSGPPSGAGVPASALAAVFAIAAATSVFVVRRLAASR